MIVRFTNYSRIPLDTVPTDTDENCAKWLHQHFKEKVCLLKCVGILGCFAVRDFLFDHMMYCLTHYRGLCNRSRLKTERIIALV